MVTLTPMPTKLMEMIKNLDQRTARVETMPTPTPMPMLKPTPMPMPTPTLMPMPMPTPTQKLVTMSPMLKFHAVATQTVRRMVRTAPTTSRSRSTSTSMLEPMSDY